MRVLLGMLVVCILNAGGPTVQSDCARWQSQVDPSVSYVGTLPNFQSLASEEKTNAIACLLALEGHLGEAKIGGVTRMDISQILPEASVEVAALFYIRYLYAGKWDHCNGIALVDSEGKYDSPSAVHEAFISYKKWFEKVKACGIEKAKEMGLDPMDDCPDVHWY